MSSTENILATPREVAYLAGAGVSVPEPSNLPTAFKFVNQLFAKIAPDKQTETLLCSLLINPDGRRTVGDYLRFETVMSILTATLDPEYDILKVFSACKNPNYYHYYLAEKLSEGAIILTTNFDNLIEIACQNKGIQYSLIVSDDDFNRYIANPNAFKRPIIKLHGGYEVTRNNLCQEKGAVNVVATTTEVGKLYPDFAYNNRVIQTITEIFSKRRVIVMGYSGGDDFDIIPAMQRVKIEKGLIWITHSKNKRTINPQSDLEKLPRLNSGLLIDPQYRFLEYARKKDTNAQLLFVEGNTAEVLGINTASTFSSLNYDWTTVFEGWINSNLVKKNSRQLFIAEILHACRHNTETLQCLKTLEKVFYELSEGQRIRFDILYSYSNYELGNYQEAAKAFAKITDNYDLPAHIRGYGFQNFGRILLDIGRSYEAITNLREAERIFESIHHKRGLGDTWHELGRAYNYLGKEDLAKTNLQRAIEIAEEQGDTTSAGMSYCELGGVVRHVGDHKEAKRLLEKALSLFSLNGYADGLAVTYHDLALLASSERNVPQAIEYFKEAIQWGQLGANKINLGHSLHSLADALGVQGYYEKAKELLIESIAIKRNIGDTLGLANSLTTLGAVFAYLEQFLKAKECLEEASRNYQALGLQDKATETQLMLSLINKTGISSNDCK